MNPKSNAWFNEISNLSPQEKKHELDMMKMELHNIELKMMIYELVEFIQERNDILKKVMLENIIIHHNKEIG